MKKAAKTRFPELKRIFSDLHGAKGCLWDKQQTHRSLLPYLREEVAEFAEAVRKNNPAHMKEELGDILLQVMFHSQIAAKQNRFNVEDVITTLGAKLKRRHPHVFGTLKVRSSRQIIANWHKIKRREKNTLKKT